MTATQTNQAHTAQAIIACAFYNVTKAAMLDSAQLCLADAQTLFCVGNMEAAARRALTSLRYSVGILDPTFAKAQALVTGTFTQEA